MPNSHVTFVVIYRVCLSPRKSPCSLPFAFFNYTVTPDVTRHHTPPCFEGVGSLSKDDVLAPCHQRDGSTYTGTRPMHCLYRGKSREVRRVLSPYIGRIIAGSQCQCSDLPCMFVSEKITVFIAICILQLCSHTRYHQAPHVIISPLYM